MELKDWLNSVNFNKENLIKGNPDIVKQYPPFIVNKCLAGHIDCIMFVNEMNKNHHLPNKLQYDFYLNSLRKKKRFSPWLRQDKIKDLDYVKRYYGYSNEKAKQALKILTEEQLNVIKAKFDTGGKR